MAALLFFRLLRRLHVPGAAFAATLLALHPLMVESVAWITERKNVLSLVFFLASLFAYGCFTRFWEPEPQKPGAPAEAIRRFCGSGQRQSTGAISRNLPERGCLRCRGEQKTRSVGCGLESEE